MEIKLGNIRFNNREFNITAIETEENEKIKINYLEIDDRLYKNDYENYFNLYIFLNYISKGESNDNMPYQHYLYYLNIFLENNNQFLLYFL